MIYICTINICSACVRKVGLDLHDFFSGYKIAVVSYEKRVNFRTAVPFWGAIYLEIVWDKKCTREPAPPLRNNLTKTQSFLLFYFGGWGGAKKWINPFRTSAPFWGHTSPILSNLCPNRDCSPKRVNKSCFSGERYTKFLIVLYQVCVSLYKDGVGMSVTQRWITSIDHRSITTTTDSILQ